MAFQWREDIRKFIESSPEFTVYRESNRGEYRVLRCDFPQLMGWSALRRPEGLPRSLKTPYFSGPYAPLSMAKERMSRPHVNRLHLFKDSEDNHMTLTKNNIVLQDGPPLYQSDWGELRVAKWKGKNNNILVRMYTRNNVNWKQVERKLLKEVCHVMETGHPNFLQYYGVLENSFWKYHLFEYMPRGDLLTVLKKETEPLPEETVTKIFLQIVHAISHLHDKDIVHRNLKLENVLVGLEWEVRIIDITHTEKTTAQNRDDPSNIAKTSFIHKYGPVLYQSPERIVGQGFNPLLDQVWGLGVILYALLFKKFPFKFPPADDLDQEELVKDIMSKGVVFLKGRKCPKGAKNLLSKIFQWEQDRPRTFELLDDPWLRTDKEEEVEQMKVSNAIGRFTHEEAEKRQSEPKRLLALRRRMFKHFKLFREDYMRQPAIQQQELSSIHKTLSTAQRFLGTRPFGLHEVKQNLTNLHKADRLYKEQYWPALYNFNPLKCRYLGIDRIYCKPKQFPIYVNLERLARKDVVAYPPPPPRKDSDTQFED